MEVNCIGIGAEEWRKLSVRDWPSTLGSHQLGQVDRPTSTRYWFFTCFSNLISMFLIIGRTCMFYTQIWHIFWQEMTGLRRFFSRLLWLLYEEKKAKGISRSVRRTVVHLWNLVCFSQLLIAALLMHFPWLNNNVSKGPLWILVARHSTHTATDCLNNRTCVYPYLCVSRTVL
jgi:hypothetical protein